MGKILRTPGFRTFFYLIPALLLAGLPEISRAADETPQSGEAAFFRLEQEIVTSASKYAQKLVDSPSAITVITKEDIRQSGTLDITQLFRFTPGVLVVEQDSPGREVMIRGYPQAFSPRLLVLMDGIPLYTPLFSGVTWSVMPFSLPSIERIEIIRGASSTLYGANAFSGVINIITKKVNKQRGIELHGAVGNLELGQGEVIWDQPVSEKVRFRLSALARHDNGYGSMNGDGQFDSQAVGQGRLDVEADLGKNTQFKFYAYVKGGSRREPFTGILGPQSPDYANLITGARLDHQITDRQSLAVQASFQNLEQDGFTPPTLGEQVRREVDFDLQYTNRFSDRDTMVAGASVRFGGYEFLNFLPPGLQYLTLASVFVNNDFKIHDKFILTTGGRYEFDSFTNNQLSGRINFTYLPFENQAFRFSAARAVRTPSVIEERLNLIGIQGAAPPPFPPQTVVDALGNSTLKPESVIAGEFGYHGSFFNNRFNADFQFYFNDVDNFITLGLASFDPTVVPPLAVFNFANRGDGQVFGFEVDLGWQVFEWWRTSVNYTLTQQRNFETGVFPKNLLSFKNRFAFKNGFSAELLFNYTSPYTFFDVLTATANPVSDIYRLDVRLAQRLLNDRFEIAIVGQNLIDSGHTETGSAIVVDRLIYGTVSLRY